MATKTAKKPVVKSAAKPAPAKKVAAPAAKKPAAKAVAKPEAAPVKAVKTTVVPAAQNTIGWGPATALWWAVSWRSTALGIGLWLLVAFLLLGLAHMGIVLHVNEESWSYRVFQFALSEYISFMVLWVVLWLIVRKGSFRSFTIELEPLDDKNPHGLDAALPFTWSVYWRLLILRLILIGVMMGVISIVGLFVMQGGLGPNIALLSGMAALGLAIVAFYFIAQVALFKWFGSHTAYKRFNLFISPRK